MDYFKKLQQLLSIEKEEDRKLSEHLTETVPVNVRRANGLAWYPVSIKDTEIGHGDYLTIEIERNTHIDIIHQLRFGMSAALFSNHDPKKDRLSGTISYISGNRLKLALRVDELPDWASNGKLGVDAIFDANSYEEMETALRTAAALAEKKEGRLINILTGAVTPGFEPIETKTVPANLNTTQQQAIRLIMSANELAIVHGPPGTGKTTTLVAAIELMIARDKQQVLVVAPSNAAVDLLSEKLADRKLNVVRVGNPARVSENLMALTLDNRMASHPQLKEIKRLKKQARDFRDMAHKYKRSFGHSEREQRRALFAEARKIGKDIERIEQYINEDVLSKANVITATLVGANHYTVRHLKFHTVIIDEASQALEPASWIAVLKAQKIVMAGDHLQLPPTIKSIEADRKGLGITLMEKCVALYPKAVVLLEEQYRMNQTIMGYSSSVFYEGRLHASPDVRNRLLFEGDTPLLFIDTAGCSFDEKRDGTGLSNPEEASFMLKHLSSYLEEFSLKDQREKHVTIAVISPYKHQVEVLRELVTGFPMLQQGDKKISINTIDSFQGQERDIVYISMTRSNNENVIGFLADIRRMNVAMTRAKKKLVVVGDSATLSRLNFYADFINYAQDHGGYVSAWEFLNL